MRASHACCPRPPAANARQPANDGTFGAMIAFEELVSALDRWRIRNGLPVVTGDLPMTTSPAAAPRTTNSMPAYAASAPRAAAPVAAKAPIGESSDVLSLGDADVLEDEELYSNDGDDFAMSFAEGAAGGNPVGSVSGSIGGRESTAIGATAPLGSAPAMPAVYDDPYAAQPGYDDAAGVPAPDDDYDPDAYPATPPPPAAQAGAAPYGRGPALPDLYDDPAYDPPGGDALDRPVTDGYAPPGPDTIDADDEIIDEATVVGDDYRKR